MRKPILLHYYITERCNCRCTFCDIWKTAPPRSADAKLEEVERNLAEARMLGARFVDFTGGEPLLHPALPRMLQTAKMLKFKTSVTTNGLRYPRRAVELRGLIDFLHLSLDAADAPTHDALRGKAVYDAAIESLETADKIGERPDILFTVTPENLDQLEPMRKLAAHYRVMLIVNPVFSLTSEHGLAESALQHIESFSRRRWVYVNKAFHTLRRRGGNSTQNPRCRVMDAVIVISPDNQLVLPCYHFSQLRLKLHRPLTELRQSDEWQQMHRRQGRLPVCSGCHLNCYFDPSFLYKIDRMFWQSLAAKAKYIFDKHLRRRVVYDDRD